MCGGYIQKNPNNPMGSPMKIRTIFCYARSYSTTSSADQKKKIAAGAEIFAGEKFTLSRDLFAFFTAIIFSTAPSTSFVPHRIYRLFKCSHRWKGSLRPTSLAVAGFRFLRLRDVCVVRALDTYLRLH